MFFHHRSNQYSMKSYSSHQLISCICIFGHERGPSVAVVHLMHFVEQKKKKGTQVTDVFKWRGSLLKTYFCWCQRMCSTQQFHHHKKMYTILSTHHKEHKQIESVLFIILCHIFTHLCVSNMIPLLCWGSRVSGLSGTCSLVGKHSQVFHLSHTQPMADLLTQHIWQPQWPLVPLSSMVPSLFNIYFPC